MSDHQAELATDIGNLIAEVTTLTNTTDSAVALINGFEARLQAAIDAAKAAGVTDEQLAQLTSLKDQIAADNQRLADAVTANTPAVAPAPEPTPEPTPTPTDTSGVQTQVGP